MKNVHEISGLSLHDLKQSAMGQISQAVIISKEPLSQVDLSNSPMIAGKSAYGIVRSLDRLFSQDELTNGRNRGIKMIIWKAVPGSIDHQKMTLWNASRAGIWNHLVFRPETDRVEVELLAFALNNANILNSWSFAENQMITSSAAGQKTIASALRYSRVRSLPGRPLWMVLNNNEQLLHFLNKFGMKQVLRWRVMDDGRQVVQTGTSIDFRYLEPENLPGSLLDEICRMVKAGGSVEMKRVRYNLERAFLIGVAREFGRVVGNSSLKHPRAEYIRGLNRNTGLDFSGYLERGYTSVRPEYRGLGIGTKLLEGLTARAGKRKIFSIISEDNLATKKIAIRNRTRRVASIYSERMGKQIGIWIPEEMIDD